MKAIDRKRITVTCTLFNQDVSRQFTTDADAMVWISALLANDVPFIVDVNYAPVE